MSLVEETMEIVGIKTIRGLAKHSGISEKTLTGWKKNLPPYAEAMLMLLIKNHDLEKELEESRNYKKALNSFMAKY